MSPDLKMRQVAGQFQRLEQRLTPQLIQSVEMLQLPIMELSQKVEEMMEENPFLELVEETGRGDEKAVELAEQEWVKDPETAQALREEQAPTPQPPEKNEEPQPPVEAEPSVEEAAEDFSRVDNLEGDQDFDRFSETSYRRSLDEDPCWDALQNTPNLEESLYEHLKKQIELTDAPEYIRQLAVRLATMLDRDGYLRIPPEEALTPTDEEVKSGSYAAPTPEEAKRAHKIIRSLDPAGVGAVDLRDCLLLQIEDHGEEASLLREIIDKHLDDVLHNRLPKVASALRVDIEEVKKAVDSLRRLTPFPGRLYSQEPTRYVSPDIIIRPNGEDYDVVVNESFLPAIRVSNRYRNALSGSDSQTKEYFRRKYQEARQLWQNIEQRRNTLYRIARKLTDVQKEFLDKGEAYLRPIQMQNIAAELGLHVSTISRAVADKYVDTPAGVFPLRRFFSSGYTRSQAVADPDVSTELSNQAVMKMVQEVVSQEDKRHPLADEAIAVMIRQRGIDIARRTVAKYREKMGILPARRRRTY